MWTRKNVKSYAKLQMREKYFHYLGISLMPHIASYIAQSLISSVMMVFNIVFLNTMLVNEQVIRWIQTVETTDDVFVVIAGLLSVFTMTAVPVAITTLASVLLTWFVVSPVIIGMYKWFLRAREHWPVSFGLFINAFQKEKYLRVVGAIAFRDLMIFLWSMLLFIPGIIKYYAYRMIPLILADNPQIGAKRALQISRSMMKGQKFRIFVLDLSFIGWYLLGLFAFCVGFIAVIPYHHATICELYDILKKDAVERQICTMEELGYQSGAKQ